MNAFFVTFFALDFANTLLTFLAQNALGHVLNIQLLLHLVNFENFARARSFDFFQVFICESAQFVLVNFNGRVTVHNARGNWRPFGMCSSDALLGNQGEVQFLHAVKLLNDDRSVFSVFILELDGTYPGVNVRLSWDYIIRGYFTLLLICRTLLREPE